jgi:catechol 2,3-dioxygenase-like lactoylglutathione lyase family enzyme
MTSLGRRQAASGAFLFRLRFIGHAFDIATDPSRRSFMLGSACLQTIVCATRPDEARIFYGETLGLPLKGRRVSGLVLECRGSELLLAPVREEAASDRSLVGFAVADVEAVLAASGARGVAVVRYDHLVHDALGIATAPDGSRVAWIRDPDGHFLSIVQ